MRRGPGRGALVVVAVASAAAAGVICAIDLLVAFWLVFHFG
jgi:hypothetical protein